MVNCLSTGTNLQGGKYRIIKTLGQGGFGITYEAEQSLLRRRVAIKEFFMKDCCERDEATSRVTVGTGSQRELVEKFRGKFIREAQMIAGMDHPNIIRVLDVFEENGTAYYVMEHLPGGSLADKVKKDGPLSEEQAEEYIRQVADALSYIHLQNTVHLDVKPSNILLNAKGDAVLIDFGISKHYDDSGEQTSSTPVGISKGYAPLEQGRDGDVSQFKPVTDIYALGATLYFLVTGSVPPEASLIYEDGLERPSSVSDKVWACIEAAMQPRQKDRPQSIVSFLSLMDCSSERFCIDSDETTSVVDTHNSDILSRADTAKQKKIKCKKKSVRGRFILAFISGLALFGGLVLIIRPHYNSVAEKQYLKLAEKGDIDAQIKLANCFAKGQDVDQNLEEAAKWFKVAAELGSDKAQYELGKLFLIGAGVAQDTLEALRWYTKAAEQDNVNAQGFLGSAYYYGIVVEQDRNQGVYWLTKAAEKGSIIYILQLAGFLSSMQNYSDAFKWYLLGAEKGSPQAQFEVGYCYEIGQGVSKDYSEAIKWYMMAAEPNEESNIGSPDAQYRLGLCYENGRGVNKDLTEAIKWYSKAVNPIDNELSANVDALFQLGQCYEFGRGVPKDYSKAIEWYSKASENGHSQANERIATLKLFVGQVNGKENGHEWVDLGLSVKWATCNVGAVNPYDYGSYFAWGETSTKSRYSYDNYKFYEGGILDYRITKYHTKNRGTGSTHSGVEDNLVVLEKKDDAASVNWGGNWRMPTKEEFQELIDNCSWSVKSIGGKRGYLVTSKRNGNSIFFPSAGQMIGDSFIARGDDGMYWSSTVLSSMPEWAWFLGTTPDWGSYILDYHKGREDGYSVRPVIK